MGGFPAGRPWRGFRFSAGLMGTLPPFFQKPLKYLNYAPLWSTDDEITATLVRHKMPLFPA